MRRRSGKCSAGQLKQSSPNVRLKRVQQFDYTYDVLIKLCHLLGWDPILPMNAGSNCLHSISQEELAIHKEPQDKTPSAVAGIPVASYLNRIFLFENGIEDWLFGQSGREFSPSALTNQEKLYFAYRPEKLDRVHLIFFANSSSSLRS